LTKSINLLEAKQILVRKANAADARSNYIILNKKYRKTCAEIERTLRTKLRTTIYDLVTPEELTTYIRVMQKFSKLN
jgi:DNA-binding MarR family transcriptional regulator